MLFSVQSRAASLIVLYLSFTYENGGNVRVNYNIVHTYGLHHLQSEKNKLRT